jgi:very-short-patch-repair endonuclease
MLVAIIDFAYPAQRIAIEADGYRWHSGRHRWQRDLARRNKLTELGWKVFHITWSDITDRPEATMGSITSALGGSHR